MCVFVQIGEMSYVRVRDFKGKARIDIREWMNSDGEMEPGEKGNLFYPHYCRS